MGTAGNRPTTGREELRRGDALLVTDIQNDFLPGGALAIKGADAVVPVLAAYMDRFGARRLPILLTRDWHPADHCSFDRRGGPWPAHCIAGTPGSLPPRDFPSPASAVIIYKAIDRDQEAYSAFQGTALNRHLRAVGVDRLFIGGLATDYCVRHTCEDARSLGYDVCLLMDAICAVNVQPGEGRRATDDMLRSGAKPITLEELAA
jgi:nicotinamidase/pyrazinamidase